MKNRKVCKSCYKKIRRKNNNNTLIQNEICTSHQQPKVEYVKDNNPSLIKGVSNYNLMNLMTYVLLQKQEPVLQLKKSLNQYPNIKAQTLVEIQSFEIHESGSTIVFDDMLLSK